MCYLQAGYTKQQKSCVNLGTFQEKIRETKVLLKRKKNDK